jgi:beta-galactosidase GanA
VSTASRRLRAALLAAVLLVTGAPGAAHATPPPVARPAAAAHSVTYDGYSWLVDGRRVYLWSGEFHYFRLPSPDLWRDVLTRMRAGGFNAVSLYFDWAYHSPRPGEYDFSGVRDVDRLLSIAADLGLYVIARPGPYINAEVDGGGFPDWLVTQAGRARSTAPDYLAAADEWLSHIDAILARHQLTDGTGTVLTYQVENELRDGSAAARAYMAHLEQKARADGITVPLVGNHNALFNTGDGALDVDSPDLYPQGFNCSNPDTWRPLRDQTRYRADGKPLAIREFQGGSFDPWGGPGYDKCRQLTGPDFQSVFYKDNIAAGVTDQNFYMTYGGTNWGWQADPSKVYSSYDYGAPITEGRQLTSKYDEDKRIGYFTQAVAPLAKTDGLAGFPADSPSIVDTARINPDDGTQFHVLRHADVTSTATDTAHVTFDLAARSGYSLDDAGLAYTGKWTHATAKQTYTGGDFRRTESFSTTAGNSVTVPFTGTAVRWVSSRDPSHGVADVYLDGTKVSTVDGYAPAKVFQQTLFVSDGLANGPHTLQIVVTGTKNPAATSTAVAIDAVDVPVAPDYVTVPVTLAGRDAKLLLANYRLGDSDLRYSTSELMTQARIGGRDIALLYGRAGQDGQTVLRYATEPQVQVLAGDVRVAWDAAHGDLRLDYTHSGLARVLVTGGVRPLLVLLATDEVAATFWQQQTAQGPVLVRGPQLLRSAQYVDTGAVAARDIPSSGDFLALTGDTAVPGDLEVFGGARILWNGRLVATTGTSSGSRLGTLPGPQPVTLPAPGGWRYQAESPEAAPGFDDSGWVVADRTASNSTTKPVTLPVLFADEYGFHHGDVWYRGHFTGTGAETGIDLSALTGRAGVWSVWLNGSFLGSTADARHTFAFPAGSVVTDSDNVVSVLVENMGHNEDGRADDTQKEARGLTGAALVGGVTALTWRIQGNVDTTDPVRGALNTGGLFGERNGWYLPQYPDGSWTAVDLPHTDAVPGVAWYRTTVNPHLPAGQDTSVGLRIDDDPARHYRAEIFVNGWQLGRYINDLGPQHSYPIPAGILRPEGDNTIAIAVWSTGTGGGLGTVSLQVYGSPASPLQVGTVGG